MTKILLNQTKQSKQIAELRYKLEKSGWKITNEIERKFKGKPKWELNDDIPNLIYSWIILRNPKREPIFLDFIAWWDFMTYETHTNDCSSCTVRSSEIELSFKRDKGLLSNTNKEEWNKNLTEFLNQLNLIEKLNS